MQYSRSRDIEQYNILYCIVCMVSLFWVYYTPTYNIPQPTTREYGTIHTVRAYLQRIVLLWKLRWWQDPAVQAGSSAASHIFLNICQAIDVFMTRSHAHARDDQAEFEWSFKKARRQKQE